MKKAVRVGLTILAFGALTAGVVLYRQVSTYKAAVAAMRIENVDLSAVKNGIYYGSEDVGLVAAEISVTVADGAIRDIRLLRHENGRGSAAEVIPAKVVEAQSLSVDAVSGATGSSKVILKAIENALRNPPLAE